MNPEQRFESLAVAGLAELERLADRILATGVEVRVVAGPEAASAPVQFPVPGTADTTAVLGHVALSTCTVELSGVRGDGVRDGRDLTGAVAAAVCDAEAERGGPFAGDVDALCAAALHCQVEDAKNRAGLVAATRLGVGQ
ncbi:phosphonate C-P lyase system protein PhnG [Arthrobacter sulfonylureivorans]|uniref:Phosphonate C-P lyase system protein PhnG n=1 Tax=Arthrobacter sulfonylureivorans TaxID=2486855 RepID=A0ABY3WCU5_9MICC|nr:phosphonate C-P lyase system protein PhnG [Arthrobacter sulfonylureivorans]UNK47826.1 phosphonate C-P lyase system protein PhnG [Arthrobacter sulfonylureivorans]